MRAAGALRRLVVDGLADVERTDPVTAGMQQVLRFGQTGRKAPKPDPGARRPSVFNSLAVMRVALSEIEFLEFGSAHVAHALGLFARSQGEQRWILL